MKTSLRLALPALLATLLPLPLMAQSPSPVFDSFSYQGRVTEANGALIGLNSPVSRKITIRIYDSATGGTLLFAEDQNGIIFNGEFSIVVGGGTTNTLPPPLHTLLSNAFAGTVPSNGYWLGVTVDDGTPTVDPEISPRQKILAAPFAVRAATADNLSAVSREIRLSDNKLFLSTGSDVNAALEMATAANPFGSTLAFGGGPLLYGGSGGVLGTKNTNGEKTALQWGQNNVTITDRLGINRAAAPTETLVVKQGSASQTSLFKVNKLDDTSLFSIDSTGLVSITENVLIAKNLTVTGTLTGNATTATTAKKLDATENSNLNSKPLYLANGSDQNALDYATIFTNNGSAFGPRLYGRDALAST
jgi:hypothetical protein